MAGPVVVKPQKSLIVDAAGNPFPLPSSSTPTVKGLVNPRTGMGGPGDKSLGGQFVPTLLNNRHFLDMVYAESWAAAKFIDIPVDDMFFKARRFLGDEQALIDPFLKTVKRVKLYNRMGLAMKAARLYGDGFLVMVFGDGSDSHTPLDLDRIGEDYPLSAVHPIDRFSVSFEDSSRIFNIADPDFGSAEIFRVTPSEGFPIEWRVHKSRMIRFTGREALSAFGWSGAYERFWGLSELLSILTEIMHDASLAQDVAHLAGEASVGVFKIHGVEEALSGSGEAGADEVTTAKYAENISRDKSNYKNVFIGSSDDFVRTQVNLSGFPLVMDKYARRLAAAADIPETRFWGRSPAGLNATGDSDQKNYAMMVAARLVRFQAEIGDDLDMIIARASGLQEVPETEWPGLIEMDAKERMEVIKLAVESIHQAWADQVIDEAYYAELLSKYDDLFGNVPEPEPPEDDGGGGGGGFGGGAGEGEEGDEEGDEDGDEGDEE